MSNPSPIARLKLFHSRVSAMHELYALNKGQSAFNTGLMTSTTTNPPGHTLKQPILCTHPQIKSNGASEEREGRDERFRAQAAREYGCESSNLKGSINLGGENHPQAGPKSEGNHHDPEEGNPREERSRDLPERALE